MCINMFFHVLEAKFRQFGQNKNLSTAIRNERIASLTLEWGQYPNVIISILEDKKYMESLYGKYLGIKSELALLTHKM